VVRAQVDVLGAIRGDDPGGARGCVEQHDRHAGRDARSERFAREHRTHVRVAALVLDLDGRSERVHEYRAAAVKDLIESKAIRRGLSLKIFDWGKVEPAGGNKVRQEIGLRRGLPEDLAKRIQKLIRDEFPKSKSQIQGDAVRVSGKSKDELQRVIARLRELDEAVPLQFENYR